LRTRSPCRMRSRNAALAVRVRHSPHDGGTGTQREPVGAPFSVKLLPRGNLRGCRPRAGTCSTRPGGAAALTRRSGEPLGCGQ
jgi:hypothetical protein